MLCSTSQRRLRKKRRLRRGARPRAGKAHSSPPVFTWSDRAHTAVYGASTGRETGQIFFWPGTVRGDTTEKAFGGNKRERRGEYARTKQNPREDRVCARDHHRRRYHHGMLRKTPPTLGVKDGRLAPSLLPQLRLDQERGSPARDRAPVFPGTAAELAGGCSRCSTGRNAAGW